MSVYAVGDLQGCLSPLERLLERLRFDPAADTLWLVGDLVNRGPRSLDTLRRARALGPSLRTVLGNHDLHLLVRATGDRSRAEDDTLDAVLDAPDAAELLDWLRRQPLAHHDGELDALLVHAGVPPGWDVATTLAEAARVSTALTGPDWTDFMRRLYGNEPARWSADLAGDARLRYTVNALTRMRWCRRDGTLDFDAKGPPGNPPAGLVPWFDHPGAAWGTTRVVAGHWSALGLLRRDNLLMLDTGCVWGGALTAVRLDTDDAQPVSVSCGAGGG